MVIVDVDVVTIFFISLKVFRHESHTFIVVACRKTNDEGKGVQEFHCQKFVDSAEKAALYWCSNEIMTIFMIGGSREESCVFLEITDTRKGHY